MESVRMAIAMALTLIASYLIGCANFAIIISKLVYHKDIRDYGSGNAGMTNIARTFGKWPAVACTIGDFLKGTIAALLGHLFVIILGAGSGFDAFPFYGNYLVALGVMLGHCFPVFYGFRGGKGILVSAGVILVLNYRVLLILLVVFLVVFLASRMMSLGSITVAALYPVLTLADGLIRQTGTVIPDTVVGILWGGMVIFLHRENIKRLLNGTESKFGKKK